MAAGGGLGGCNVSAELVPTFKSPLLRTPWEIRVMGEATRQLPVAAGDATLRSAEAVGDPAVLRQLYSPALHHEI